MVNGVSAGIFIYYCRGCTPPNGGCEKLSQVTKKEEQKYFIIIITITVVISKMSHHLFSFIN